MSFDKITFTPDTEVTFTPDTWRSAQIVTIQGEDDNEATGDKHYVISVEVIDGDETYKNLNQKNLSYVNKDNDQNNELSFIRWELFI